MKTLKIALFASAIALVSGQAMAQTSSAGSNANNNVNVGVSTYGADIPRNTRVHTTPSAIAPGLAAGSIVCAQSASGGGSVTGIGISFGTTRKDEDCNGRSWISTMGAMAAATGDRRYLRAAHYIACDIDMPGSAMRRAGLDCGDSPRMVRYDRPSGDRVAAYATNSRPLFASAERTMNASTKQSSYVDRLPILPASKRDNVRYMKRDGVPFARVVGSKPGQFKDYRLN